MKFYIASSIHNKEEVKELFRVVDSFGHEIIGDWTNDGPVSHDSNYFNEKQKRAIRDLDAIINCDVFVILSEPTEGKAKYSELGIALTSCINKKKPEVYVIGDNTTSSLFLFHPLVKHRKNIQEVLAEFEGRVFI